MTTKAKTSAKAKGNAANPNALEVTARDGVPEGHLMAETIFLPVPRHAATGSTYGGGVFGSPERVTVNDGVAVLVAACKKVRAGDLSNQRDALTVQAMTLDSMFTEMARRAALNFGQNVEVVDRYMRLALKAQSQSRATIEAIDRLVRGGEQVIKHVHVDNRGGQAMIADTINTGGHENGKTVGQPYAIESHEASCGQPLRSANTEREAVPVAGDAERAL